MENQTQTQVAKNKPSKLNRIISIVLLAVIAFFAISTLILAVTPKNFNIGLSEPTSIKIKTSNQSISNSKWYKGESNGVYEKVMELCNNSFNTTLLNALFKGVMFKNVSVEEGYSYFSSIKNDYIEFQFNDVQTIKVGNTEYTPSTTSIYKTYVSVIIEVSDKNSLEPVSAYIRHGGENTNYSYSRIKFNSYANQHELHNYINSL